MILSPRQDEVRRMHGIEAAVDLLLVDPRPVPRGAATQLLAALAEDNSCNAAAIERCNGVQALLDTLRRSEAGMIQHAWVI